RRHYQMESLGSGIIYSSNGYILTNYHVIQDTDEILVKMSDGRDFSAKIIGTDQKTDLAVLKVFSLRSFPQARLGKSGRLRVGEWVMAIGNPYGLEGTVTVGVISGIQRSDLGIATFENFIQTDASINPGNSGGPLINLYGEVIGVNTAVAEIGAGVGFAIPIQMVVQIIDELIENGEVERGWLGVGIQNLTPDLADSFDIDPGQTGVVVNSVSEDAPAKSAGLRQGDIIVAYDGKKISDPKRLQHMVAETQVGRQVMVQVLRNGEKRTLPVTVGKYSS
ncbi:MAG: S1C family serine protease, partial [Nitrospinaceae bacterium]